MSARTPVRVVLFGATGRMGKAISRTLRTDRRAQLVGTVRRDAHGERHFIDSDERDVGETLLDQADVAIDFSLPEAVEAHVALCSKHRLAYVCGVTALSSHTQKALAEAARVCAVLWAPNMSVGVTVCFGAAADIASRLGPDFSVAIHDVHHAGKQDAPSGTALEFGRVIEEASQGDVDIVYSSVREGAHPGEHHIMFNAGTDVIELRHTAGSRDEFAQGAVRAAVWLSDQSAGFYNMRNVLGITSS